MNLEISPDFWLGLAKVTILLLTGFVLTLIFKAPKLRAITWSVILAFLLPVFFLANDHFFSFLKIVPQANDTTVTPVSAVVADELIAFSKETESAIPILEKTPIEFSSLPTTNPSASSLEVSPAKKTPYFLYVYFVGLLVMLLPLVISYFQICRLPKIPATGLPLSIWQRIQQENKNPPKLQFTPSPAAPFSSGIFSPKVLIPCESQEWSTNQLNSCLFHEAAHLKNRDPLTRTISAIIRAIFWFHPLVWYAHRELIQAQEQICDQHALRQGIKPECYAEELLAAASYSHLTPSEALSMAKWSQIGNRIRYILHPSALKSITVGQMRTLTSLLLIIPLALASIGFASEKEESENASGSEDSSTIELLSLSNNRAHILTSKEAQGQELVDLIKDLEKKGITKLTLTIREGQKTSTRNILTQSNTVGHSLPKEGGILRLSEVVQEGGENVEKMKLEDSELHISKNPIISEVDIQYAKRSEESPEQMLIRLTEEGGNKLHVATSQMRKGFDRIAVIFNGRLVVAPVIMDSLKRRFTIMGLTDSELQEFERLMEALGKANTLDTSPTNQKAKLGLKKATAVISFNPGVTTLENSNYLNRELQYIVAYDTLAIAANAVINDFNSHNDATDFLKRNIMIKPRRGTDLIEITASHQDSGKAAQIANSIASAYLKRRNGAEKQRRETSLAERDQKLAAQENFVKEKRQKLTTLIQRYGIPYQNKTPYSGLTEEAIFRGITKKIEGLEDALYQIKSGMKNQKDPLKVSDLGGKLKSTKAQLERLKDMVDPGADNTVDLSLEQHEHNTALREYEIAQEMLRAMKIRQQEARVLLKMPHRLVTIHEKAR